MKTIFCATLGSCVHVAGVFNFMRIAQKQGYKTYFLRPPNTNEEIISRIEELDPDVIALSYRLTPAAGLELVKDLIPRISPAMKRDKKWIFGGTAPVCKELKQLNFFDKLFEGITSDIEVISFLNAKQSGMQSQEHYADKLIERIYAYYPYPLIRAHFGLPSMEETIKGIEKLAQSKLLDVISIAADQDFQEHYFIPSEMKDLEEGAGGVPIRSETDLRALYAASRQGNYPLLRCYSGTRNLLKMAPLLHETINNAWCATPLFWYSELDGRSQRLLKETITECQQSMAWHGARQIPFESNDSHHWSLRSAPDAVAVTVAFLCALNAKKAGVTNYISQLMFNTPLGIAPRYDLAKMMAKTELIESLHDESFKSLRQVRTGLLSYPEDPHLSQGHLASSIQIAMFLKPHIVHVVSYCEATHAATPEDVVLSVKIARKVISNSLMGLPRVDLDPKILTYKNRLKNDAKLILMAIQAINEDETIKDPFTNPAILTKAVQLGILDAPHLKGLKVARGEIITGIVDGKCLSLAQDSHTPLPELERLNQILEREQYPLISLKQSTSLPIEQDSSITI